MSERDNCEKEERERKIKGEKVRERERENVCVYLVHLQIVVITNEL